MRERYRESLQAAVAASAGPYGYTVTLWCSGILAVEKLGHPVLGDVLLLAAGAIAAFLALAAVAYGAVSFAFVARAPVPLGVWAHAHLLAAMVAATAVWVVLPVVGDPLGWAAHRVPRELGVSPRLRAPDGARAPRRRVVSVRTADWNAGNAGRTVVSPERPKGDPGCRTRTARPVSSTCTRRAPSAWSTTAPGATRSSDPPPGR